MKDFLEEVVAAIIVIAVCGWFVMMLAGMWHDLRPAVPPISFMEAVLAVGIGRLLAGVTKPE